MLIYVSGSESVTLKVDDYYITKKEYGLDELSFSLSADLSEVSAINEETQIFETTQRIYYNVKAISVSGGKASYKCQIDLDAFKGLCWGDWNTSEYVEVENADDTITTVPSHIHKTYKSTGTLLGFMQHICLNAGAYDVVQSGAVVHVTGDGWTSKPSEDWSDAAKAMQTTQKTIELESPTLMDICTAVQEEYGVRFRYDNYQKKISLCVPASDDDGLHPYAVRSVNLQSIAYSGKTSDFYTRVYAAGKDGRTFADINNGCPWVDDTTYSTKIIAMTLVDERYELWGDLWAAAKAKLAEVCVPQRSWSCSVIDLYKIDPDTWKFLQFDLFTRILVIDDQRGFKQQAIIKEYTLYPYYPEKNKVSIETVAGTVQKIAVGWQKDKSNRNSDYWQVQNARRKMRIPTKKLKDDVVDKIPTITIPTIT